MFQRGGRGRRKDAGGKGGGGRRKEGREGGRKEGSALANPSTTTCLPRSFLAGLAAGGSWGGGSFGRGRPFVEVLGVLVVLLLRILLVLSGGYPDSSSSKFRYGRIRTYDEIIS